MTKGSWSAIVSEPTTVGAVATISAATSPPTQPIQRSPIRPTRYTLTAPAIAAAIRTQVSTSAGPPNTPADDVIGHRTARKPGGNT